MALVVRNLTKAYGVNPVLNDVSLAVNTGDRAGIVGMNGAGKTTLLRIIVGQEQPDSGSVMLGNDVEVGHLPQTTPDFHGATIDDLIRESVGNLRQVEERMRDIEVQMAAPAGDDVLADLLEEYGQVATRFQDRGGYDLDHRIDTVLAGVGIAHLDRGRVVATLSGGEKERVGLATLLLRAPDLLLLDEPTNHLDVTALEWLEDYLARYSGALVVVSHDRQFLNRTVNQIWEIDEHTRKMKRYSGDYDEYIVAKAAERARWEEEYARQQEEIRELRRRIRETGRQVAHNRMPKDGDKMQYNFKGENVQHAISRNVHAAEEQLRRIEANPFEKPPKPLRFYPRFDAKPLRSDAILKAEGLAKRYGDRWLFRDINFVVEPDTRIVIAGPNGAGKTTLLRLLAGRETPDAGEVRAVGGARLGYLSQEAREFPPDQTLLAAYKGSDVGPESNFVAALLAHGLFRLEDVTKTVGQLSAGQRRKLELARLMADCPNVLLLDEPTNYISLDVLEAFESAVLAFPGPVIAVSHDRWFIQRFGGAVWRLEEEKLHM